ncbi:hypothetical protein CLOP_g20606 [Closterium sp. NIES-67]|nr:hypothetical protein CLOP_g20606 [Closterium sp. NIES-67]
MGRVAFDDSQAERMGEASPAEPAPAACANSADPSAATSGSGPPAVMAEAAEDVADLLIQGARYGDMEDVAAALDGGADAGVADDEGRTALHMAAANGHTEIAKLLLQRGAPVNAPNRQGNTPLHWAAVNGRDSMVHLLIAAGANPSSLNSHERTPVDEAIHSNNQHTLDAINAALATRDAESLTVGGSQGDDTGGDGAGDEGCAAAELME